MNNVIQGSRNGSIRTLKAARPTQLGKIDEYVAEVEHQEGEAYWLEFESPDDLIADFDLYVANAE